MESHRDSAARIKLAGRILMQLRLKAGQPLLLSEIAQLRFLAESGDELNLPLEELARTVIARESKRLGFRFPAPGDGLLPPARN